MKPSKIHPSAGTLLLIDDNRDVVSTLVCALESLGHTVDYANDVNTSLRLLEGKVYDAAVVDGALPGLDGLNVVRRIRASFRPNVPLLMVSARINLEDRINALEVGADDCLTMPFSPRELDARITALLRWERKEATQASLIVGDLQFDPNEMKAKRGDRDLYVSAIGLKLMSILMRESPQAVTRAQLERHVWGSNTPCADTLRSHLYMLRKAIDKPFGQPLLHTMRHLGYRISEAGQSAPN